MKRKIATLLLLAMALGLLTGCGGSKGEQTAEVLVEPASPASAPKTATATLAHDWSEPNAVDDSYNAEFDDDTDASTLIQDSLLPEYVNRLVENGEILETELKGYGSWDKSCYYGWICFTGTPKAELGWRQTEYEGKPCYCRSVFIRIKRDENGMLQLSAARSIAMEPVLLNTNVITIDGAELHEIKELPELKSAELYVPELGQSYLMTDPATLQSLHDAVVNKRDPLMDLFGGDSFRGVPPELSDQETLCPIYLHLQNGNTVLILAAGDGANVCVAWGDPDAVFNNKSVFERFGVPLDAAGYSKDADGCTIIEQSSEGVETDLFLHYSDVYCVHYDTQGRVVCKEHRREREDMDYPESNRTCYYYLEDGRVDFFTEECTSYTGDAWSSTTTYIYNEQKQLIRVTITYPPGTTLGSSTLNGYYFDFKYDEQGRLLAREYHYADGTEGKPSGNAYYWYDEDGVQHRYGVDQDGNLTGGPEDDAGDHPVRR